jgi:hypothetical protein
VAIGKTGMLDYLFHEVGETPPTAVPPYHMVGSSEPIVILSRSMHTRDGKVHAYEIKCMRMVSVYIY